MKRVNVFCNMYGKRLFVGRLAAADGEILFQYAEEFLESRLPLSPFKLPLQPGVFKDERMVFDGLHGLFNDSLPDGWGLLLLDRKLLAKGRMAKKSMSIPPAACCMPATATLP